jgi:CARDB protein
MTMPRVAKLGIRAGLAAVILVAASAAPASAAKRPDLVIAKLSSPPASEAPGGSFKVKATTRNRGKRKARASATALYLSPKARVVKHSITLGKLRVKALRRGARTAGRKKVTIPAATAARSYHLIACADSRRKVRESNERNNCRASRRAIGVKSRGNPTSSDLIDDAVASGEISPDTGLKYKVFAAFGDSRLPAKYDGASDALGEAPLDDVIARWDRLSANARKALGPFLIPPYHQGSYLEQEIHGDRGPELPPADLRAAGSGSPWCVGNPDIVLRDWSYVEATHGLAAGKIRIWYQDRYASTDAPLARDLMNAMERKIWPGLVSLMGREPLPDGGSTDWCAGGSDAVDIALVDVDIPSTYSHTSSNENTPAQMYFPRSVPAGYSGLKPLLAHEFMHMIQYSFTFGSGDMQSAENRWLREGTAQWAMDYVTDPKYGIGLGPQQEEHQALKYFFPNPDVSLDSPGPGHHDYGSYVFPLWAVRSSSNPSLVREIWDAVGAHKSLDAAKSAFGGGWNQAWKDFVRANWNQGSIDDYRKWDGITDTPKVAAEGTLGANQTTSFTAKVAPAAAKYMTFRPEEGTDTLTYTGSAAPSGAAGVQAIITHTDGSDSVEDWSGKPKEEVPACNVKEITLALSNSSITPGSNASFDFRWKSVGQSATPKRGALAATAAQCGGWPKTWEMTFNGHSQSDSLEETWGVKVTLERLSSSGSMGPGGGAAVYGADDAGSGQFNYHHWWEVPGLDSCSQTASGGGGSVTARLFLESDGPHDPYVGPSNHSFSLSYESDPATFHTACDSGSYDATNTFGEGFDSDDYEPDGFSWDGDGAISGSTGYSDATHSNHFTWELAPG